MNERGRRGHDVGGSSAGPCRIDDHTYETWELRADALGEALWGKAAVFKVDELRRLREDLGANAYDHMGYYERWLHSLVQALIENGVVTVEEIARALALDEQPGSPPQVASANGGSPDASPRFSVGETVRVRMSDPPGHVRTPWYCRGKRGEVTAVCGVFANPEDLAYPLQSVTAQPLYRVRFSAHELWPNAASGTGDTLEVEIYQHWLSAVDEQTGG